MFKQMSKYFEYFLSNCHCGFREGFSAQQCILSMLEKQKSDTVNRKTFGALLTDLSKAFVCLSHDLLIQIMQIILKAMQKCSEDHEH